MKAFSFVTLFFLACLQINAEESVTKPILDSAKNFLATLNEEQSNKANIPFANKERENWHFFPMDRKGLRLDALNAEQQKAAHNLLAQSLSAQGHTTAKEVIQLEALLFKRSEQSEFRNPQKYTVTIFGLPSTKKSWGWRFEGHHLSLNFTVIDEKVTLTAPFFFGTNPAEVRKGDLKGLRPLGDIEDAARKLAREIHGDGHHVRYTNKAPNEVLTKQDRVVEGLAHEGVSYAKLKEEQQKQLLALVRLVAAKQREKFLTITAQDLTESQLAWAGEFEKREPHYFRIQTPQFLIEYANTQNDANHAHLVWRDFKNDFGRNLLKEHLESDHAH